MTGQFPGAGSLSVSDQIPPASDSGATARRVTRTARAANGDFGQTLLTHVELCYSVALGLTRDSRRAQALVKDTLVWAWQLQGVPRDEARLKMTLLCELRRRFLGDRGSVPPSRFRAAPALEVES